MKSTQALYAGVPLKMRSPPSCLTPPSLLGQGLQEELATARACPGRAASRPCRSSSGAPRRGTARPAPCTISAKRPFPFPAWHCAHTLWRTGSMFSLKKGSRAPRPRGPRGRGDDPRGARHARRRRDGRERGGLSRRDRGRVRGHRAERWPPRAARSSGRCGARPLNPAGARAVSGVAARRVRGQTVQRVRKGRRGRGVTIPESRPRLEVLPPMLTLAAFTISGLASGLVWAGLAILELLDLAASAAGPGQSPASSSARAASRSSTCSGSSASSSRGWAGSCCSAACSLSLARLPREQARMIDAKIAAIKARSAGTPQMPPAARTALDAPGSRPMLDARRGRGGDGLARRRRARVVALHATTRPSALLASPRAARRRAVAVVADRQTAGRGRGRLALRLAARRALRLAASCAAAPAHLPGGVVAAAGVALAEAVEASAPGVVCRAQVAQRPLDRREEGRGPPRRGARRPRGPAADGTVPVVVGVGVNVAAVPEGLPAESPRRRPRSTSTRRSPSRWRRCSSRSSRASTPGCARSCDPAGLRGPRARPSRPPGARRGARDVPRRRRPAPRAVGRRLPVAGARDRGPLRGDRLVARGPRSGAAARRGVIRP